MTVLQRKASMQQIGLPNENIGGHYTPLHGSVAKWSLQNSAKLAKKNLRSDQGGGTTAPPPLKYATGCEVDEKVYRDKNGDADGMNLEVDSKDEVMHI